MQLSDLRVRRRGTEGGRLGGREFLLWLVLGLTALSLALDLSQIHQSLFADELYTYYDVAHASFRAVLRHVNSNLEASPPLYFLLAWATAKLGDPTVWLRIPSIMLGSATVPLVYMIGRESFGRWSGAIGAAIFALNPFTFFYGVQARPFAAMAFFVALSTWALLRAVRGGDWRWWALYAVACAAAAYCHYTCIFALVVQGGWSLWRCRDRLSAPALSALAAALFYVPWLPFLRARNVGLFAALYPLTADHVSQDLMRMVAGYPLAPIATIPTQLGIAVVGACALAGIGSLIVVAAGRGLAASVRPSSPAVLIVGLALASPVGIVAYSLIRNDLWSTSSIYASVPAASLVLAALVVVIPRPAGALAVAAVAAVLAFGLIRAVSPGWQRPPFRAIAAYLDREVGPQELVSLLLPFGDPDLQILLQRPHRLTDGDPWGSIASGQYVVVVALGNHPPAPAGFTLLARRKFSSYTLPATVWTYRRR